MEFLDQHVYHNSLHDWGIALGASLAIYFAITGARRLALGRLKHYSAQGSLRWPHMVEALLKRTRGGFLVLVSVYVAGDWLTLPPRPEKFIHNLVFLGLLYQLTSWGNGIIRFLVDQDLQEKGANDGARAQSMRAIGFIAQGVLLTVILLWGLDNFGVNITTLVAGLGVGGIAVALAVQNILGDLFASLTIVLDKPFVYGDYIAVGDFKGTIEHVGLKTTRVRSMSGEQLIFPNSDLLQSRIRNYKRMQERRVAFNVGVTYSTPIEKLKGIPQTIQNLIESEKTLRFERSHLINFGTSSLDFETVYWVLDSDYQIYMDAHQRVNLGILKAFNESGIEFAFTTQTVFNK